MSILQAVLLGLVQGVTEFLPISSSGHLILLPLVFDWPDQGLLMDAAANSGTLVAVMIYFREDLRRFFASGVTLLKSRTQDKDGWLALVVLVATLPVAVAGLVFYDFIGGQARNPILIAWTSIVFGLLLFIADRYLARRRELSELRFGEVFAVGLAQAVALLPGTSRSGATMTAGMALGLNRENAARLSFLLAIPVGLLVAANDVRSLLSGEYDAQRLLPIVVVFLVSGIVGYLSIGALLAWLRRQSMGVFVIYRVLLGIALLLIF